VGDVAAKKIDHALLESFEFLDSPTHCPLLQRKNFPETYMAHIIGK
jgi:hypothetical protein